MRVAVVGAGVAGLAAGARLAALGHDVTVLEQAPAPGGKCGRVETGGYAFDSGPSLLTMPWVLTETLAATGAAPESGPELVRVEPGTEYRFVDGQSVRLGADLPPTLAALERLSPGAGDDWSGHLGTCAAMWRASAPVLSGPAPWPPRRPRPGERRATVADLVSVRPWQTLRGLARGTIRDPRLRMVVERAATYAGADPRRAPAALAVAGYVEHAFGAWHLRGGMYAMVEALARRLGACGGELRLSTPVRSIRTSRGRVRAVETDSETVACEAVVSTVDAPALEADLLEPGRSITPPRGERSLSGFALMLGLRGRTPGLGHHTILFPRDYDAEFDDVFGGRPARDPTLYVAAASVTDPGLAPEGCEAWFVLVNAPVHGEGVDWDTRAEAYEEHLLERLRRRGLDAADRIEVRARRTPSDLERETGARGGAIYGQAPHGRLGTVGRLPNAARRPRGLYRAGGTVHPGGGLPLVLLGAAEVAREIGPA